MRPHIREFIVNCAQTLPLRDPIVEIGARLPSGQERIADLRSLFPGRPYLGCDMQAGAGVDRIENLEKLSFADGEVGSFILCDTLEHVRELSTAIRELHRCLDPLHGILIATCAMAFPIHGYPSDYWRFTPEGFRRVFDMFDHALTFRAGDPAFPHSVCIIAGAQQVVEERRGALEAALGRQKTRAPHFADSLSAAVARMLADELIRAHRIRVEPAFGFGAALAHHAWVLTPGAWIHASGVNIPAGASLYLRSGVTTLMTLDQRHFNVRSHQPGEIWFQFEPQAACERVTQLQIDAGDGSAAICLARSEVGVVLADLALDPAFIPC